MKAIDIWRIEADTAACVWTDRVAPDADEATRTLIHDAFEACWMKGTLREQESHVCERADSHASLTIGERNETLR